MKREGRHHYLSRIVPSIELAMKVSAAYRDAKLSA